MYQTKNLGLNITEIEKDSLSAFNFDTDLGDNFKAIDEKTLSHRNITNCLLEVPQDIKLELVDGVLTLKEGSKVYIPNGFEADGTTKKFDKVEITVDKSNSTKGSGDIFLAIGIGGNLLALEAKSFTVTERPESTVGTPLYYNITTNKAEYYDNSVWNSDCSFPIAIVERTDNGFSNIKQVFNGMGYIGSTFFALPGLKGLAPNGRYEDGKLNNVACEITKVSLTSYSYSLKNIYVCMSRNGNLTINGARAYNEKTNYIYNGNDILSLCEIAIFDVVLGNITNLRPKKPFHAVDYFDYQTKITELETKIATLQAAVEALQG